MRDGGVFFLEEWMMQRQTIDFIGYAAATCTTISFLPQLIRVVRLRSAREISLGMFSIFSIGTALWLSYGVLLHSKPVMIANAVTFVLAMSILVLKLRFDHEAVKEVHKI
jgi:MtN3 and saliva related transmembrane protein